MPQKMQRESKRMFAKPSPNPRCAYTKGNIHPVSLLADPQRVLIIATDGCQLYESAFRTCVG